MMVLAILSYSAKYIIATVFEVLGWVLFVSAMASWIPQVRQSKLGEMLYMLTEPLVRPMRRLLHTIPAMRRLPLDFSPLATYFVLILLERLVWMI